MSKFSDWLEGLTRQKTVEPTYPAVDVIPIEDARLLLRQIIEEFMQAGLEWNDAEASDCPFLQYWTSVAEPPVHALCASTGIGKTQEFAATLAPMPLSPSAAGA